MSQPVTVEAKRPKGPKVLAKMTIEPAMGGGHTVTHHYSSYEHEPKPYNFPKGEGARAAAHVLRHAGLPAPGAAAAEPEEESE